MPITFNNASGSVAFALNPARGDKSLSFQQAAEETTGSTRYAYPLYVKDSVFDLPLRMSRAEKESFLLFWFHAARGSVNKFNYTVFGYTYVLGVPTMFNAITPVRFASPALPEIQEKAYDLHTCTVKLRVA